METKGALNAPLFILRVYMANNILKITSSTGRRYIFDAISNNIYETDNDCDFSSVDLSDLGYLSDIREDPLSHDSGFSSVLNGAKTFIIELTEECNFRCKYCVFDEENHQERNHSEISVSIECAKNELERFYERTNGVEGYVIFYGGEPLLEFEKIKELVDFGNKISRGIFKYSLTTNGVLLTRDKVDFLIENDFLVTVSIDGPQEIHDEMRISKNGKGTHQIIEGNLRRIFVEKELFFSSNIIINCTISNEINIDKINRYFSSSDLFSGKEIRFSTILQNEIELNSKIEQVVSLDLVRKSLNSNLPAVFNPVEDSFFGDILKKIRYRKIDESAKQGKKICIPFANRTYLRSNGSLQFCERVESYGLLSGNVDDIESASTVLHNDFKSMKEMDCSVCFAYNFCEMCPASFITNGKLDYSKSKIKCEQYRSAVKKAIEFYIQEGEKNE